MKETLEDIRRKLEISAYKNEEHVRLSLVVRLLQELGWDIWNPAEVNTEFNAVPNEDYSRVDIALFLTPYTPAVFVEVKAVGKLRGDIRQYETQLRDYNRNNTAVFTVITDGQRWRLYYSLTGGEFSEKCFKVLDLFDDNLDELEQSFQSFLSRAEVGNGSAEQKAKNYLQLSRKQRAMEDVLPEARKAVLEPPYPNLPEAIINLVGQRGVAVTLDEAFQFIKRDSTPKIPSSPERVVAAQPVTIRRKLVSSNSDLPEGLAQILEVCIEVIHNGLDFADAANIVADRRGIWYTTVRDKFGKGGLGLETNAVRELLREPSRLIEHLVSKYPHYEERIREMMR